MSMMLAQRYGEWFLVAFAPHIRGCNLSTNQQPRHHAEKFHLWQGRIWVQSEAPLDGITFYPELRYRGAVVHPTAWHHDSKEPLLWCLMWDRNPAIDARSVPLSEIHAAKQAGNRERWLELIDQRKQAARAFRQELIDEGWKDLGRDGLEKYIHVDELEKIEGPAPEGVF